MFLIKTSPILADVLVSWSQGSGVLTCPLLADIEFDALIFSDCSKAEIETVMEIAVAG